GGGLGAPGASKPAEFPPPPPQNIEGVHGQIGWRLIGSQVRPMLEAPMRKTLLALIFAGAAPVAIAPAPSWALVGAVPVAKPAGAGIALMRVDYYLPRHHYRGYRSGYYGGPAYFAGARAYYAAPAYAPPPVVYYPPVIVYYPPPVVAYPPPVAPYAYGAPPLRRLFGLVRGNRL